MDCEVNHGIELIRAFLDDRADSELKKIFYFAQPNSFNMDKEYSEFKKAINSNSQPLREADEIMTEVKDILTIFS